MRFLELAEMKFREFLLSEGIVVKILVGLLALFVFLTIIGPLVKLVVFSAKAIMVLALIGVVATIIGTFLDD